MGKIGMRMVKTAICVFICLAIFIALKFIEKINGVPANFAVIIYNPFFAGIATAYSLHSTKQKSLEQAKNRCIASLIGGIIGIILITVYELISNKKWPGLVDSNAIDLIIPYLLVVFVTISVIYTAVRLKQKQAVFVSILTFLSCTVNPNATIATEVGTWLFGVNRILSTVIGVLIALGVNLYTLPRFNKNKDLLFAVGIEGILHKESDRFENFIHYKFNSLVIGNVNVTLFTTRPPVTFMHLFDDSHINNPVICCSGAAIYDANKKTYIAKEEILYSDSLILDEFLSKYHITPIKNYIINDTHYIYCGSIDNDGERKYIDGKKNKPYCNTFVGVNNNNNDNPLYYLIIEHEDVANKIMDEINNSELGEKFTVQIYDHFDNDSMDNKEIKYIKIYSKNIDNFTIVKDYCNKNNFRLVGLSTYYLDRNLLRNSDISVTSESNNLDGASIVLKNNSYDSLFKTISKVYYSKKYKK